MKTIIILIIVLNLKLNVKAQNDTVEHIQFSPDFEQTNGTQEIKLPKESSSIKIKNYTNGVMLKNGKMWLINQNKIIELKYTITMSNGTKAMNNGSYIVKGGSFISFNEGEQMDMNGKIIQLKK
jgi:hypothetical protein